MNDTVSVSTTLDAISGWFSDRLLGLGTLRDQFAKHLSMNFDSGDLQDLPESTRAKLKRQALAYLREHHMVDGCGIIFAHSVFNTANGHLEWWVRESENRFANYVFGVVPGADRYYDYEHHEWFIGAYNYGDETIMGPYIDYLGVEAYIMTFTVPLYASGTRVGAVGQDIQMVDLEKELLPILARHTDVLIICNKKGTVLLSNSSDYLPGFYLGDAPEGYSRTELEGAAGMVHLIHPPK